MKEDKFREIHGMSSQWTHTYEFLTRELNVSAL